MPCRTRPHNIVAARLRLGVAGRFWRSKASQHSYSELHSSCFSAQTKTGWQNYFVLFAPWVAAVTEVRHASHHIIFFRAMVYPYVAALIGKSRLSTRWSSRMCCCSHHCQFLERCGGLSIWECSALFDLVKDSGSGRPAHLL